MAFMSWQGKSVTSSPVPPAFGLATCSEKTLMGGHSHLHPFNEMLLLLRLLHWQLLTAQFPFKVAQTLHELRETCHPVAFYFMKKDSKRYCDTTTPESIHTKDESKRGSAFAFIFGVN